MSRSKSSIVNKKNSIKELKLKMELDELRNNLMKETHITKHKSTFNKKSRMNSEYFSPHDTLCNYSHINDEINDSPTKPKTIHYVLRKMLDLKKSNRVISQEIIDKQKNISTQEKMILQLYDELNYHLNEHSSLAANLGNIKTLSSSCEKNRNEVTQYCNKLKSKFKSYVEIIDMYENTIKTLKQNREQIIKTSDAIIEMKINERCKFEDELEKTNSKIDYNVNMIFDLGIKLEDLKKEKDNQKNKFLEVEKIERIRFDDLNKKYLELVKQSQEYQIIQDELDNENNLAQLKITRDKKEKENREIKLKDYQLKNEYLQKQFEEINFKLTNMSIRKEDISKLDRLVYGKQATLRSQNSNIQSLTTARSPNMSSRSQSFRKFFK